jgi:hypothetical protein
MKFKVGDRVQSFQPAGFSYTGVVKRICDGWLEVDWDNKFHMNWSCKILSNGKVATANGCWDNKSLLEKIGKEVSMKNAKYGIKYDRDSDPVEFFEKKKDAEKRIEELLKDRAVDQSSMFLFEVGRKWEIHQPVTYELIETK